MSTTQEYDVAIIGGGPTGSTAATLCAQAGARVLVLEREVFPRFHIGESLLPANLAIFERLGTSPAGTRHLKKHGAVFVDELTDRRATYLFADSLGGISDHAFQVERSVFDLQLLENAERAGATVHQGERVTDVELAEPGADTPPVLVTPTGRYPARYVFDASGLDSFFAYANRTRQRIELFGLGTLYRHYALAPAIAAEVAVQGNIRVIFVQDGWMWAIPLGEGRMSVGLVTRRKGLDEAWFDDALAASGEMRSLLEGASLEGPTRRMASFSFLNEQPYGPRWSSIGDAAAFLDPMFSSGVALGMISAERAVDALMPRLEAGEEGDPALMEGHAAEMKRGYEVFATLINAIYRRRFLPDLFFTRDQDARLRAGMTSVLAGDVWREDNPFTEMLMRSRLRVRLDEPVRAA